MDIVTLYNPLGLETTVPPVAATASTGNGSDASTRLRRPPGPPLHQPFMQGMQQAFTAVGMTASDSQGVVIHDLFAAMASETYKPQDVISALHQMIAELSSGKASSNKRLARLQDDFAALAAEQDDATARTTDDGKGTLLAFLKVLEPYAPPMPSAEAAVGGQINTMA